MLWKWWGEMAALGIGLGFIGAWSENAVRVFMKTLALPLVLVVTRLAWPDIYPLKNSPLYTFIDFVILAATALAGDYILGLKLGRHDRGGFRSDSVGH